MTYVIEMSHGTTRQRDRHRPVKGLIWEGRQKPPVTGISYHRATFCFPIHAFL
ncbi:MULTISPECIES: hypothetical protein [Methanocalculus]|uniref:hypothetical protein n=1 Tax=Methanocalculus TaxID=71151 RepID=UPI0020A1E36A|nr:MULTISPECIES: hypothetical protein [unclassified Methanocalculus]MCP1662840.1 hypothetical protein [Methanocalculus sp. AMF5]